MSENARLNPPDSLLGTINAVMGGAGRGPHHVGDFEGPLSIKFMVRGAGVWRSDAGVHCVDEGYFLVLNHGQSYSLDIEGGAPRESFCPFFRRGFVEDIQRVLTSGHDTLLEDPQPPPVAIRFPPHLQQRDPHVVPALHALRRVVYDRSGDAGDVEEAFVRLAEALLCHHHRELPTQIARVPASRSSTRAECFRRLALARDYLHAHTDQPLTLARLAAEACLSPYHFLRQFKAVHGVTPNQYLTRLRLQRACRMLRDTDMAVTRIALTVGFENPAAFSRRFSAALGIPPVAFRAAQLRKNGKAHSARPATMS